MGKRKKGKQGAAHLSIIESSVEIGAKLIEHFSKWREAAPEAGCSSISLQASAPRVDEHSGLVYIRPSSGTEQSRSSCKAL